MHENGAELLQQFRHGALLFIWREFVCIYERMEINEWVGHELWRRVPPCGIPMFDDLTAITERGTARHITGRDQDFCYLSIDVRFALLL